MGVSTCYLEGPKCLKNLRRSKRGMNTIIAEAMMVLIVIIISAILFVFYSGVFGALLGNTRLHPENFTIVAANSDWTFILP
jgi:hypothetical protein